MNPPTEEPKTTSIGTPEPVLNPATFVPDGSSPQADEAAMQAIGALEAEEDTTASPSNAAVQSTAAVPPSTLLPLDKVTQPAQDTKPIVNETAPLATQQPAKVNTDPFAKQEKSSKTLILAVFAAIVVIGGGVAAYFAWQTM